MFLKKGASLLAIGILGIMVMVGCRAPEFEGGIVHLNAGRFDEAIKNFEIALQSEPNNSEIYLYLAKAYANKKDFVQANAELNTAQEKDTTGKYAQKIAGAREEVWYKVYNDFALTEFGQKNFDKALEYFQLCTQLDPSKKESFFGAGATCTLLAQNKNVEAAGLEEQMKNPELTAEQIDQLKSQISALCPASLVGSPALSLPWGKAKSGLPLAVQLIGPAQGEGIILRLAKRLEEERGG